MLIKKVLRYFSEIRVIPVLQTEKLNGCVCTGLLRVAGSCPWDQTCLSPTLGACKPCLGQDQSIPTQDFLNPKYRFVIQAVCRQSVKEPWGWEVDALGNILHLREIWSIFFQSSLWFAKEDADDSVWELTQSTACPNSCSTFNHYNFSPFTIPWIQ